RRRLRSDLAQGHRHRHARAAAVQRGARHLVAMSTPEPAAHVPGAHVIVEPASRDVFLALMRETYGSAMSVEEYDWWFDRNPAGPRIVNEARDGDGTPLGVLAMSCFRMSQGLAAYAVHAVTTPAGRGRSGYGEPAGAASASSRPARRSSRATRRASTRTTFSGTPPTSPGATRT